MLRRIAVRLASLVGVLLLLTVIVFLIQQTLPSDPVKSFYGRNTSPEVLAEKREEIGLDDPIVEQYTRFMERLVQGDLGTSLRTRQPVRSDIGSFLPATIELAAAAAVVAVVFGGLIGILGSRPGRGSSAMRSSSIALAAVPTFLAGILGILVFYRWLGWLPAGQRSSEVSASAPTGFLMIDTILGGDPRGLGDAALHLIMPAIALGIGPAVAIGRTLRASLRETYSEEYIRTARAKGVAESTVIRRHALRNAVNPALAMAGLQLGLVLAGAVVVEVVFSWPGIGLYLSQGIASSDFPAVIGVVFVLGIMYVLVNAAVDTVQLLIDPRLRA